MVQFQGVAKFMGCGTGSRRYCRMFCRAEVRVITDVHVMFVSVVTVPFRNVSLKPEIKTVNYFFVVIDDVDLKAYSGLGKPYGVDLFEDRDPFRPGPVAAAEVDAQGNAVHRFEHLGIPSGAVFRRAGTGKDGYRQEQNKKNVEKNGIQGICVY